MLLFRFTCLANTYRVFSILTGIWRTMEAKDDISVILRTVPAIAMLLWICSNAFIVFVWYPCLKSTETEHKKQ